MLLRVRTHAEYLAASDSIESGLSESERVRLASGKCASAREKMRLMDLDPVADLLPSLYSQTTGRPANDPTWYVRSLALMLHFGHASIQRWADDARSDAVLRSLIGAAEVPAASCHHDLVNRIAGDDPHMDELWPAGKNTGEGKRAYRELKRNEKWVNYDEGDTLRLKEKHWNDASCDANRPTRGLELLLDLVAVAPSAERHSIVNGEFVESGDGSCLPIHASPDGNRVLSDDEAPDGRTHRYTAADADFGWDSYEKEYFYGYMTYNISWHSPELAIDLPLFVSPCAASQHDALTLMSSFSHMLDVDPGLLPDYFCHDSAADAAHIFDLLQHRGTVPIIDWNPRRADKKSPYAGYKVNGGPRDEDGNPLEHLNEKGVPVCAIGDEMCRDGYDKAKMATKFRCSVARGKTI